MSNLIKFMMVIIALAMLSFLNSVNSLETHSENTRGVAISPEKKQLV